MQHSSAIQKLCVFCYMGEKTETQMYHRLLWELPKQSCVDKVCARASIASECS